MSDVFHAALGQFPAALPAPMSLGAIPLDDGTTAVGFAYTHKVAEPLTHHDGRRNVLAGR